MAIGDNSYGSVAEVEALTALYTSDDGEFDATTRPTLTQVEMFIDRVSGVVNTLLAGAGFSIPVTQSDAKLALDGFVVQEVVALVELANGAGPFVMTGNERRGASTPQRLLLADCEAFIEAQAQGLEALGATRARTMTQGLDADDVGVIFSFDWSG
jgi:hypothetical protein